MLNSGMPIQSNRQSIKIIDYLSIVYLLSPTPRPLDMYLKTKSLIVWYIPYKYIYIWNGFTL